MINENGNFHFNGSVTSNWLQTIISRSLNVIFISHFDNSFFIHLIIDIKKEHKNIIWAENRKYFSINFVFSTMPFDVDLVASFAFCNHFPIIKFNYFEKNSFHFFSLGTYTRILLFLQFIIQNPVECANRKIMLCHIGKSSSRTRILGSVLLLFQSTSMVFYYFPYSS